MAHDPHAHYTYVGYVWHGGWECLKIWGRSSCQNITYISISVYKYNWHGAQGIPPCAVLSRNFVTGGCTVIDRRLRTLALGIGIGEKLGDFKMAVSLEPFDRFWCFNFWLKALDVYFYPGLTAGQSDPHNRRSTAAAASCGQHCLCMVIPVIRGGGLEKVDTYHGILGLKLLSAT